jgi:D-methionine transport system substrate-binding protein
MRTTTRSVLAATAVLGLGLAACGQGDGGAEATGATGATGSAGDGTVTVAATAVPHADILRFVDSELAADAGLDLEVVEFDDYAIGNRWLSEGEVDANYFQHAPYLEAQTADFGYDLHAFEGVHIEPYAAFSQSVDDVADLPEGALVGITDDASNQARALDLLAGAGLVTLPDDVEEVTVFDLQGEDANPLGLQFVETDPAQLPRSLGDFDLAVLNGNYFLEAGLSVEDALLVEDGEDNPYANFLAVRAEDAEDPDLVALDELLRSDEVRGYIEETWPQGDVLAAF